MSDSSISGPRHTRKEPEPMIRSMGSAYAWTAVLGYPLIRFATGAILIPHGGQRPFGWFGADPGKIAGACSKIGFEPGWGLGRRHHRIFRRHTHSGRSSHSSRRARGGHHVRGCSASAIDERVLLDCWRPRIPAVLGIGCLRNLSTRCRHAVRRCEDRQGIVRPHASIESDRRA
jgi:hypothetical protein